ncbi:calponin [Cladophialophora chaetospira]|uniref:Calponin n=1 Tax=Cladophialophora chaetospira TaxID=386627 RepID=A0AA38XKB5_9EURO|nr:calponin [Cladophialophora chaetospira]
MASVTSLDQDMRKLRLERYTPGAAKEVRQWIESTLGERLAPGDLMEALRDGVALCKLVNMAVATNISGVRYKESNMPFVQMENIAQFLTACERPPLNLPSHDRFLTVDLYDSKDPAQVLQCIAAFSRRANQLNSSSFPTTLGAKSKSSMSPQGTGSSGPRSPAYTTTAASSRPRGSSNTTSESPSITFNPLNKAAYSGRVSPTKNTLGRGGLAYGGSVSSWSSKADEGKTAPAWNIHQYGYMGGASQGNQGVAFGARRQITSPAPNVPSLAEKEKRLKEEAEQKRQEQEYLERQQRAQREAEEEQARLEEERRWAEETQRVREQEAAEQRAAESQRLQEEERVRRDEQRRKELQYEREREREAQDAAEREAHMAQARSQQRTTSDARLNGQFLSQYQSEQTRGNVSSESPARPLVQQQTAESQRIAELERQLEEMKAQQRQPASRATPRQAPEPELEPPAPALPSRPRPGQTSHEEDWSTSERDYLRQEWEKNQDQAPPKPPRPEPSQSSRPLPDPAAYQAGTNRTDRYLATNNAPSAPNVGSHRPQDFSTTTEVDLENQRRIQSQQRTKAGGWASKSLLEREMERERERQREWEESQKDVALRARDVKEGSAPGQSWDVHQYGYMGGDSQNRGGTGLGVGGARRQIIGPRPPP